MTDDSPGPGWIELQRGHPWPAHVTSKLRTATNGVVRKWYRQDAPAPTPTEESR